MKKGLAEKLAYYALIIVGVVFILSAMFNALSLDVDFINVVMSFATEIAILLMVLVVLPVGWTFAKSKSFVWQLIYIVAAVLIIVSSVMNVIG